MATEQILGMPSRSVTRALPWIISGGALLVYLLTLNHWVPLHNTALVARASGWAWQPVFTQPLTWAVLYPFRWLPNGWVPLALNLFNALCASLVLMLLARSVALLPHDVKRDDPLRLVTEASILSTPTAWIPPVLAAMLCGLQLSFWENATSVTTAMIDLLLFAYIIRCLLEFRFDQDQRWLSRCAFVYGVGMANDWALVAYVPIFIAALVRITGFGVIYNRPLLRRTVLWWLAGLSLYFLLPVIQGLSADESAGFWGALKSNLKFQKSALSFIRRPAFRVLALASLLPMVVLSIRWRSHTLRWGDDTGLGLSVTKISVHFAHAVFFVAALWLALDPGFSPRHLGLGPQMLSYYYLSAMVAGYCAGYFLLLASSAIAAKPPASPNRPGAPPVRDPQKVFRGLARIAGVGVWALLVLVPLGLLARNLGQIRITNGPAVREYSRQLWADLPAGKSVVLSEDARALVLLRAEVSRHGSTKAALPLETRSLRSARYQRSMAKQFPSRWPVALATNEVVGPQAMVKLVTAFAAHEPVVYAHPSSGLFFERFADRPNGLIHQLVRRGKDGSIGETLAPGVVAANEQLWRQRWDGGIGALADQIGTTPGAGPEWAQPLLKRLSLKAEASSTVAELGAIYSKALNYWGVQMQRMGRWEEAGVWFDGALALNVYNLTARLNSTYNLRWQRGDKGPLEPAVVEKSLRGLFEAYRNWAEILDADGPVDEPTYLLRVGHVLMAGGNYRQAALEFGRCAELAPGWAEPRMWQALSYVGERNFSGALELADRIEAATPPHDAAGPGQILICRIAAYNGLGRTNDSAACVSAFLKRYQDRKEVLATAADVLEQNRQFKTEVPVLEMLLRQDSGNLELLARKGWCELQLARFEAAIATLTDVLSRDSSNSEARLHRAIACFASGQVEPARADFQELLKTEEFIQNARFGLAAIARRQQDTNAAVALYEAYLANTLPGSRDERAARARLKLLGGKP